MLLGKIQSGKTKIFMGVIALSFEKDYGMAIVLTKGTKALAEQTYTRIDKDFDTLIEGDHVKLFDIMNMPDEITPYVRSKKLILVVKKQADNLNRLVSLFDKYEDLRNKKLLIIDDEADYASIGFKRDNTQPDDVSINVIATKVNQIRDFGVTCDFLQVTATPYSLYLQPETFQVNGEEYHPLRPAFTSLVPIHDKYIGGDFYFEQSEELNSVASYVHIEVPDRELQVLSDRDQRYISNIQTTPNLETFRKAITNFIVGGSIRRIQNAASNYKCSFIIHTELTKAKHQWQIDLTLAWIEKLREFAKVDVESLRELVNQSIEGFKLSSKDVPFPSDEEIFESARKSLIDGYIGIAKINSDQEIRALLDKKGQLRLENPFNIFIGGQILDRGITVENLIGFFYGRNPRVFQLDTVLQHSRMFGPRNREDLCVTRFYTTGRIYNAMKRMHNIDSSLRAAFERGEYKDGVVFLLRDDSGQVKPCAPNKILISSTETIRPYRRLLPRAMQTQAKPIVEKCNNEIERILKSYADYSETSAFLIDCTDAEKILREIANSYEYSERYGNLSHKWDVATTVAVLKKLTCKSGDPKINDKVYCIVRLNRQISRLKANGVFTDAPDDGRTDRPEAKQVAKITPCLQLFEEVGTKENGWKDVSFWWPVLVCPENTQTAIFAAEAI
jgi:hypothetical protein